MSARSSGASLEDLLADKLAERVALRLADEVVRRLQPQLDKALAARPAPTPAPHESAWLPVGDSCRRSGFKRTKMYELIATGAVVSTKVGTRRLIDVSSLGAFMNAGGHK